MVGLTPSSSNETPSSIFVVNEVTGIVKEFAVFNVDVEYVLSYKVPPLIVT